MDFSEADRTFPPLRGEEAATLRGFLDLHRDTLRWKTAEITAEQLATPLPPSEMTLGGMLKHLALVESTWFSEVLMDEPLLAPFDSVDWSADRDWDWHSAANDSPEQLRGLHDAAVEASDRNIDLALTSPEGLDRLSVREHSGGDGQFSLRWILTHMIEEYARHNGHADLIRQSLDGLVGH